MTKIGARATEACQELLVRWGASTPGIAATMKLVLRPQVVRMDHHHPCPNSPPPFRFGHTTSCACYSTLVNCSAHEFFYLRSSSSSSSLRANSVPADLVHGHLRDVPYLLQGWMPLMSLSWPNFLFPTRGFFTCIPVRSEHRVPSSRDLRCEG